MNRDKIASKLDNQVKTLAETETELAYVRAQKASGAVITEIQNKLRRQLTAVNVTRELLTIADKQAKGK